MKRFMIALLAVAFSLTLIFSAAEAKTLADIVKAGKIVIGVKGDYPPWGVINAKNEFEGWEIDLCHKLAEYLFGDPSKVEFVAVTGEFTTGAVFVFRPVSMLGLPGEDVVQGFPSFVAAEPAVWLLGKVRRTPGGVE